MVPMVLLGRNRPAHKSFPTALGFFRGAQHYGKRIVAANTLDAGLAILDASIASEDALCLARSQALPCAPK